MKYFIAFFLMVNMYLAGKAQGPGKSNILSLELGKTGLIYNLSYDHRFPAKKTGFRIYIGTKIPKYIVAFTTGGGLYFLQGKKTDHLETGIDLAYLYIYESSDDQRGLDLIYPNYTTSTLYLNLNFGYRKYFKKTMFRIGLSPGITKDEFIPGGYISFGWKID